MVVLSEALGFPMVGLLEASQYSYGWTYGGPPGFVWLNSWKPPGLRIVLLLEDSRYLPGWTLRSPPVFVWLDYQRLPGLCIAGLLGTPGFRMVGILEAPQLSYG